MDDLGGHHVITGVFKRWKREGRGSESERDGNILALKMEEEPTSQGMCSA